MYKYLKIIDDIVMNLFNLISNELPDTSKMRQHIIPILQKIGTIFENYSSESYKLITEVLHICKSNKSHMLKIIRMYFYITLILYSITMPFLTMFYYTENNIIGIIAHLLFTNYTVWTIPIRKYRYLIKYIYIIPYKICKFFVNLIQWVIVKIFHEPFTKPKAECMQNGDPLDRAYRESRENDCIKNGVYHLENTYRVKSNLMHAGEMASFDMSNDKNKFYRKPTILFEQAVNDYKHKYEEIEKASPCHKHYDKKALEGSYKIKEIKSNRDSGWFNGTWR